MAVHTENQRLRMLSSREYIHPSFPRFGSQWWGYSQGHISACSRAAVHRNSQQLQKHEQNPQRPEPDQTQHAESNWPHNPTLGSGTTDKDPQGKVGSVSSECRPGHLTTLQWKTRHSRIFGQHTLILKDFFKKIKRT